MQNLKPQRVFDLEERTARFGERSIEFAKKIPKSAITLPLINQFIRSATSVGANYCEADCAESRKDFIHKIGICKKEAKETKHWLRMITQAINELAGDAGELWREANELQLIFITIVKNTKQNQDN